MSPADRKAIGQQSAGEAKATYCRRTELTEQKAFISWLNLHDMAYIHARTDRKSTIQEGSPDFHVFRDGKVLSLEFKAPDGTVSEAQEARMDLYRRNGCEVIICHSAATAIEITKRTFRL
jgi:hypothetical protein